MNEKQLINTCKEIIDILVWDEYNLLDNEVFEESLNEKLNTNVIKYSVVEVDETDWEDTGWGKYYAQHITYQLVQYDSKIQEYPTEESTTKRFNIYFDLYAEKTGSYYTEYYYQYEEPKIKQKKIIHVPEQIIPAHDEEKFEFI